MRRRKILMRIWMIMIWFVSIPYLIIFLKCHLLRMRRQAQMLSLVCHRATLMLRKTLNSLRRIFKLHTHGILCGTMRLVTWIKSCHRVMTTKTTLELKKWSVTTLRVIVLACIGYLFGTSPAWTLTLGAQWASSPKSRRLVHSVQKKLQHR